MRPTSQSLSSLLLLAVFGHKTRALERQTEFQRYDGWYNNLANPVWGTVGSRLYRKAPPAYADGVYMLDEKLPSARVLSDLVFSGDDGLPHLRNCTTMLAFFSQVVAYEVIQATEIACPLEMHKIKVSACDEKFDPACTNRSEIPFQRAKYDQTTGKGYNSPREQTNAKTAWIDASFLYSTQEPWVAAMRAYRGGRLLNMEQANMTDYPPFNSHRIPLINPPPPQIHRLMDPERLFLLGDPRVNENPGLLSYGLMFYRWHNRQADRIAREHADWSDEDVFQAARRWVIATLQNVVNNEFLSALLNDENPLPPYEGYKSDLPPSVSHLFAAAAFRFPHSIVPPGMLLRRNTKSGECKWRRDIAGYSALRLCQNWWNAQDIVLSYGVDEIILGMASQIAERDDNIIVTDLRDFSFGPMHYTRLDLTAIDIMRGRDNGLPDYNTARKQFNLPEHKTWEDINPQKFAEKPEMFSKLAELYGNITRLDVFVGGMLESTDAGPGSLFKAIIVDQFTRIRDADRFYFENDVNGLFSEEDVATIKATNMYDIIKETTEISGDNLQRNVFYHLAGDPCPQPHQVNTRGLEPCVPLMRLDHFMGNEVTYIFSCILLACIPILAGGVGYLLIQRRRKWKPPPSAEDSMARLRAAGVLPAEMDGTTKKGGVFSIFKSNKPNSLADAKPKLTKIAAIEWLHERHSRSVMVVVNEVAPSPTLKLQKVRGGLLRLIELSEVSELLVMVAETSSHDVFVLVSLPNDYDMVLRFSTATDCAIFERSCERAMHSKRGKFSVRSTDIERLLNMAETKEGRQNKLEHFFREAYATAFRDGDISTTEPDSTMPKMTEDETFLANRKRASVSDQSVTAPSVMTTTLTRAEFADALGMREDDLFIQRMFACTARRHSDKICFAEFLDTVKKFSGGAPEQRLRMIFDMCDLDQDGTVECDEFCKFLESLNVSAGVKLDSSQQWQLINEITKRAGAKNNTLTYAAFESIFADVTASHKRPVGLHLRGKNVVHNKSMMDDSGSMHSFAVRDEHKKRGWFMNKWVALAAYVEDNRQHIAWLIVFYALCFLFSFERFWYYRYENEHRDLRRVMGTGIAITRGAAGAMSFCFGIILLTVCRNLLTKMRNTFVSHYIPLDAAIPFHRIVALTLGCYTTIHAVGHLINFYHVATQSSDGLKCLFKDAVFSSNFQPSIFYWLYNTVTGVTGVLCVILMSIIYVFAIPAIIHSAYSAFRITHMLNIALYALTIAHGLPKLLDSPRFLWFVAGPAILFIIDRMLALRQDYRRLQIYEAEILPSDVMVVKFKRPRDFNFVSGQWVRTSCPSFEDTFNDRHAFSIASAPYEKTLTLFIKAVGPWTWKLHNEITKSAYLGTSLPMLHMDGPYGAGNQQWADYEVAIMVAGGIGVTPYASILKDMVNAVIDRPKRYTNVKCKKVYFLWICNSHKNYEWFIDVLREVEQMDKYQVLDVHVFVTQYFHKFDLRTTMLYICEKHFRSESGRSMFTNLRATNHFGRPNVSAFLKYIQSKHAGQSDIGVFSCGPSEMNRTVGDGCRSVNSNRNNVHFTHRYETF